MAREKGSFSFSGNFEVGKKGTLDARAYCPTYADLLLFTSADFIYNGHLVTVWDTDPEKRGVYRCINESVLGNASSWEKIGTADAASFETKASKGIANGYAALDGTGKVPASQLPAATGSSDNISEGSTNLYFQTTRVLSSVISGFSAVAGTISNADTITAAFNKVGGFINNIAATIRGTVLTGFTSANSAITATDTVLSATGKAQGQISALQQNIPTAAEVQAEAPANDSKFVTPSKMGAWWIALKANGISGASMGVNRMVLQNHTSPVQGDFWNDGSGLVLRQNNTNSRVLHSSANPTLAGTGTRIVEVDAAGVPMATTQILPEDQYVTDNDIVSQCVSASYTSANEYNPVIVPLSGKTFYGGCYCLSGEYMYWAKTTNSVIRIKISL